MPQGGHRTRTRMRRALNLEHSSCFFAAIDAYCVRCRRFSGYDPSDIGRFRRAVWGDDLKIRRTVAQRGSGGFAWRLAPRCGQCLLAGYSVQCRDDVLVGPFSVYLGGLFGVRRVLLTCGAVFTLVSVLLPFSGSLPIMLALLVLAGLTAGTFYPLTLSIVLRNLPMKYVLLGIAVYAMDVVITLNIITFAPKPGT